MQAYITNGGMPYDPPPGWTIRGVLVRKPPGGPQAPQNVSLTRFGVGDYRYTVLNRVEGEEGLLTVSLSDEKSRLLVTGEGRYGVCC
jgi:hypothetical protein